MTIGSIRLRGGALAVGWLVITTTRKGHDLAFAPERQAEDRW